MGKKLGNLPTCRRRQIVNVAQQCIQLVVEVEILFAYLVLGKQSGRDEFIQVSKSEGPAYSADPSREVLKDTVRGT